MDNSHHNFDLARLIEEEKKQRSEESAFLSGRKKKAARKRLLLTVLAGALAVTLVAGLIVYDPFTQSFRSGAPTSDSASIVDDGTHGEVAPLEWWQGSDVFPTDVAEWSTIEAPIADVAGADHRRFTESDALRDLRRKAAESLVDSNVARAVSVLPSREAGFTDDVSKAVLEDGSPNYEFSFWTREGFLEEFSVMVNRLNNPRFGGWQSASEGAADEATKATLADLFTSEWLVANGADALPILTASKARVDVNYLPSGGTRWIGAFDPESESSTLTYDETRGGYVVDFSAEVTYSAWQDDKTVATTAGTLRLRLVPNYGGANAESANRVLIAEASLALGT